MKKILMFMILFGCGYGLDTIVEKPVPQEPPPGEWEEEPPQISHAVMQGYMNQYCDQCHSTAAFMGSERALRGSSVKERLVNKSMPPGNAAASLPENVRIKMINYF